MTVWSEGVGGCGRGCAWRGVAGVGCEGCRGRQATGGRAVPRRHMALLQARRRPRVTPDG
ncbi:hypothetical protein E2C01_092891 [Portunus trituberculatus]|uniref:Uncharacterized protein n=1 Tax=Portunus trituberculatus TaxID=210409 RepID=A0A5B7JHM6_PORTR|nr:hypothetical protein [Portunus trituberculatus]